MELLTPPTVWPRPLSRDKRFLDIHHNFGLTCQFFAGLFERLHLPDWKSEGGEWIEQPNFSTTSCLQPEVRKHQQRKQHSTTAAFTKWTSDRGRVSCEPPCANDNHTESRQTSPEHPGGLLITSEPRPPRQSGEGDSNWSSWRGPSRGVVI